ncbi:MAG: hypothetical protein IPK60_07015 [Sandaracinaceae bacterium]|nr:hypothetical protein [Sandaracinaceae bacterium]
METRSISTSDGPYIEIDVCSECRGYYFDFDDGEPSNIARALMSKVTITVAERHTHPNAPRCPDCQVAMEWMDYLKEGPVVARCGECMSLFVPDDCMADLARVGIEHADAATRSLFESIEHALTKRGPSSDAPN